MLRASGDEQKRSELEDEYSCDLLGDHSEIHDFKTPYSLYLLICLVWMGSI